MGVFSFTTSNSTDGFSKMGAWENYNNVHLDLTFETSSPVLLDGGTDSFETTDGVGYE